LLIDMHMPDLFDESSESSADVSERHRSALYGLELCKAIRANKELDGLAMMVLTSAGLDEEQVLAFGRGVDAYVRKPIRRTPFYQALCHAKHRGGAGKQLQGIRVKTAEAEVFDACILLAEDNEVNQTVAKTLLQELGCNVRVALNGREAIHAYLHGGIDLILMDCQMPVLDGYDACKRIRQLEQEAADYRSARLPIVALTAHAMRGDREVCLNAGMDDYLSKPFSREQLVNMLHLYLPDYCKQVECSPAPRSSQQKGEEEEEEVVSVLDAEVLKLLPGDSAMLDKILTMFLSGLDDLMKLMESGVDQKDAGKVMHASHTLKSSSAMIGAAALSGLCKEIETISGNDNLAGVACMVQEARKAAQQLETEIRTHYLKG